MARRSARRLRSILVLACVAALVGVLLFAADRLALQVVESRVAHLLQIELGTPALPQVDIEGFPFLTKVVTGSINSVHVVADGVGPTNQQTPTGQQTLPLAHLDLRLRDVTSQDRFKTFDAARVDGTATMDYPTAQRLAGLPVTYAREGRVELQVQTTVVGTPVTARIVGQPVVNVAEQTLTLANPEITVAGVDVGDTTSQALLNALLKPVPITGLPIGLSLTGITAQDQGLDSSLTGDNISFTR